MSCCLLESNEGAALLDVTDEAFYASDYFTEGYGTSGIHIVKIGNYFKEHFILGEMNKAEPAKRQAVALRAYRLSCNSLGRQIENAARESKLKKVCLVDVYRLMCRQMEGQDGFLDTGGERNLSFVNDNYEVCHIVHVKYLQKYGGWAIGACPIRCEGEEDYLHSPENEPFKWYTNRKCIFNKNYKSFS